VKERAAEASPEGRVRYNELKGPFLAQVKARLKGMQNGASPEDEEWQLIARRRFFVGASLHHNGLG
jgi:hypothetical protein